MCNKPGNRKNFDRREVKEMSRLLPILFNTEMVRAIMDGRKKVTRRLVKPQPTYSPNDGFSWKGGAYGTDLLPTIKGAAYNFRCAAPYKQGDILYVRETWCDDRIFTKADTPGIYFYKASATSDFTPKWKPSIHMPKEAARIFLKVTDVRLERLQDITPEQAMCEGTKERFPPLAVDEFRDIWESTVDRKEMDRYGWEANPWVWVIEFERCERPVEF